MISDDHLLISDFWISRFWYQISDYFYTDFWLSRFWYQISITFLISDIYHVFDIRLLTITFWYQIFDYHVIFGKRFLTITVLISDLTIAFFDIRFLTITFLISHIFDYHVFYIRFLTITFLKSDFCLSPFLNRISDYHISYGLKWAVLGTDSKFVLHLFSSNSFLAEGYPISPLLHGMYRCMYNVSHRHLTRPTK